MRGDASLRRFFRVRLMDGGTLVAMVYGEPLDAGSHPQLVLGRYFERIGFPVPRLTAAFPDRGLLLYEDLGDRLLEEIALGVFAGQTRAVGPGEDAADLYRQAVRLIAFLQGPATRDLPQDSPALKCALDRDRFLFELRFFREHYVERFRGLRLAPPEQVDLELFFDSLAARAAAPPWVLCHRDYHSRNLMLKDGELRVTDFQDARLGPAAYDLASLLRDSYVTLPAELRSGILDEYVAGPCESPGLRSVRETFDTVALQRNLKALGTFGFQVSTRGQDYYRPAIPRTWRHVFEGLANLPDYAGVRPILERIAGP
jgi:aminoglycoside/choline kinase family phosphotransferase